MWLYLNSWYGQKFYFTVQLQCASLMALGLCNFLRLIYTLTSLPVLPAAKYLLE